MVKNYLVFIPSLMSRGTEISYSICENGKTAVYSGRQTNEAVAKYLMVHLYENGERLSQIIMLCSKEVLESVLEVADGKTTYEYLTGELSVFYRRVYGTEAPDDFYNRIPYENRPNESIHNMLGPIEALLDDGCPDDEKNLFIDYTGGMRSAAMTLVFISRILQSQDVVTKRILYSSISDGKGAIEECTNTYNLFEYLARRAESRYDPDRILDYFKNSLPKEECAELENISRLWKQKANAKETGQAKNFVSAVRELEDSRGEMRNKTDNFLVRRALDEFQDEPGRLLAEGGDELALLNDYLERKEYARALNYFRQKYVNEILPQKGFFQIRGEIKKDGLTDEILSAVSYYEKYDQNNKRLTGGFLKEMLRYLYALSRDAGQSPKKTARWKFSPRYTNLKNRYEEALNRNRTRNQKNWFENYAVKDAASKAFVRDRIRPYLTDFYAESGDIVRTLELSDALTSYYCFCGYPFECIYKDRVYAGYAGLYDRVRDRGIVLLDALYRKDYGAETEELFYKLGIPPCTYEELIAKLTDSENLHLLKRLFPFVLRDQMICKGSREIQEWDEFIYSLAESIRRVNKVRNKIEHPDDKQTVSDEEILEAVKKVKDFVRLVASVSP